MIRAIGPTIHHVGDGEQARIVKLAINLMIAVLAQSMSEALVLGEAAGVSREALLEVMGSSAVGAPFVKYKTEPLLRDDFSATFTTALMEKDIDLVLDAADEAGVELPLATRDEGRIFGRPSKPGTQTTISSRSSCTCGARPVSTRPRRRSRA